MQLRWITYPAASYEVVDDFEGGPDPSIPATVNATVGFLKDGHHFVHLEVQSDETRGVLPYRVTIKAFGSFSFDLERAVADYKPKNRTDLPPVIAVNVARIVYAGAREYIAMMTSRATYGGAMLESLILEPSDVELSSDAPVAEILAEVFKASKEEIQSKLQIQPAEDDAPRRPKRRVSKSAEA